MRGVKPFVLYACVAVYYDCMNVHAVHVWWTCFGNNNSYDGIRTDSCYRHL